MALSREDAFRFVWLIGLVSLFSDMTYQGAHGNAGPYLAVLGAGGTVVGIVAGAGEFVNYTLRLFFGYWADKSRAYWLTCSCARFREEIFRWCVSPEITMSRSMSR